MNQEQYKLSRALVERHDEPRRWMHVLLVICLPGLRPHYSRCLNLRAAQDDLRDGYAPDLTDPSAVGPLLELASERPGFEGVWWASGRWEARITQHEECRTVVFTGQTPGEALALFLVCAGEAKP